MTRGSAVYIFVLLYCYCEGRQPILPRFDVVPSTDYYWRDYAGIIPKDAVPGGLDLNNRTTYIGQGFVGNVGIIPGVIYPEEKILKVPEHGVKKVDTYIKILCSPNKDAFKWLEAKTDDFFTATINKFVVSGGVENNNLLYIGRIAFQGELLVGKIVTNSPDTPGLAPIFVVSKDKEVKIDYYEVLIYDNFFVRNIW